MYILYVKQFFFVRHRIYEKKLISFCRACVMLYVTICESVYPALKPRVNWLNSARTCLWLGGLVVSIVQYEENPLSKNFCANVKLHVSPQLPEPLPPEISPNKRPIRRTSCYPASAKKRFASPAFRYYLLYSVQSISCGVVEQLRPCWQRCRGINRAKIAEKIVFHDSLESFWFCSLLSVLPVARVLNLFARSKNSKKTKRFSVEHFRVI